MRIRLLIITVLSGAFLLACTGPSSPPVIDLLDQGTVVPGLQGAYCWDGPGPALCVDPIEPQFETAYPLPASTPISLQLEKPLPDSLTLSLSEALFGDATVTESVSPAEMVTWNPAVAPGAYVLTASATWKQGDVTYWFYVELK